MKEFVLVLFVDKVARLCKLFEATLIVEDTEDMVTDNNVKWFALGAASTLFFVKRSGTLYHSAAKAPSIFFELQGVLRNALEVFECHHLATSFRSFQSIGSILQLA